MIVAALTGSIATGKSTISKTFIKHNIPVVDADQVSRDVVISGSIGLKQIVNCFGDAYLNADGSLNRIALGKFVFDNSEELKKLTSIMMPLILEEVDIQINLFKKSGHKIIVYDAPTLIESGNHIKYHPLIVASCPKEIQLKRLMKRNGLSEADALTRINCQMPTEEKIKFATFIIDTSGTIEDSVKQTEKIILSLKDLVK